MDNRALTVMREKFLDYCRDVVDRRSPFDAITAPTLYSRYEPFIPEAYVGNANYKDLYIEIMAATICRVCWKHEFMLEKTEAFSKVARLYSSNFAKNYKPPLWPNPNGMISTSEAKAAIRSFVKTKLPEFSKDKSLDSNSFLYKMPSGNMTVWLLLNVDKAVLPYFHASIALADAKQRKLLSLSDMSTLTDSDCHWKFTCKEELQQKFDLFVGLLGIVLPTTLKMASHLIDEYGEDEFFSHLELL